MALDPLSAAAAEPTPEGALAIDQLIAMALEANPALAAELARERAAQAAIRTARALPNPEVEWLAGRQGARLPGVAEGSAQSLSLTQRLELPSLRRARLDAAESTARGVRASVGAFRHGLVANVKRSHLGVLRAQAELRNAREDAQVTEQIYTRVKVRVETGEAPRFELLRAEAERLNAQRTVQTAQQRVGQALAELRRVVGPALPPDARVAGSIEDPVFPDEPPEALRSRLLERHPELVAARADLRAAEARVRLEEAQAAPSWALRLAADRNPDLTQRRVGVQVTVPLLDRREGPIAEARAVVQRARSILADREHQLGQALAIALQQQQIALDQVAAFEGGIVREAESAMRVAEAAYRFGERGILDYLDAQRVWRAARNELNAARFELRAARVEIERLRAEAGLEEFTEPAPASGLPPAAPAGADPAGPPSAARPAAPSPRPEAQPDAGRAEALASGLSLRLAPAPGPRSLALGVSP